ncbi:MAG: hypothetical protein KDK70_22735 [Myxococcales bacterium]|nr:hypothetical protein [Myxococcales bacterium]
MRRARLRVRLGVRLGLGLAMGLGACRPASYGKDVQVLVPTDPPSDGPGAAPSGPSPRVHRPAEGVQVLVPHDEVTPRGVVKQVPGER